MTAPNPAEWGLEHRALVLRTLIGEAEKALAEVTKGLKVRYPFPASVLFESPLDGASLGSVQRARVAPVWEVVSLPQLEEHFIEQFPAAMETVYDLDVPGVEQPVALPEDHPLTQALLQAAPELLTPRRRVPDQVIADALRQSEHDGQPAAPGIQQVRKGQGSLNVVYDKKTAPAAIGRLARAGRLDWSELGIDLGPARPALPGGDEQPGAVAS